MKLLKNSLIVLLTAIALFAATTLVPLKGHYVAYAALVGDATYRDDRGIPLVFLKRSLADGECEVANKSSTTCLPLSKTFEVQDQREVSYTYFVVDIVFWILVSVAILKAYRASLSKLSKH